MKRLSHITSLILKPRRPTPPCDVLVRFTGAPPCDQHEHLIRTAADSRDLVPLHWLEERLARALYKAELGQGAWALDIGAWGPTIFRDEAARIVAGMRHEFGYLVAREEHADLDTEGRVRASN